MSDATDVAVPVVHDVDAGRVVDLIDVLMRTSAPETASKMRQQAPIFDRIWRARRAWPPGSAEPMSRCVERLASERSTAVEPCVISIGAHLFRTSDLSVEEAVAGVVLAAGCPVLYATCCCLLALIRLEFLGHLEALLDTPAGTAYKAACTEPNARSVTLTSMKMPVAPALIAFAIKSSSFSSANYLIADHWVARHTTLLETPALCGMLIEAIDAVMAHRMHEAIPLFTSQAEADAALAKLPAITNMTDTLRRLAGWQRQRLAPRPSDQAVVDEKRVAWHADQGRLRARAAGEMHVAIARLYLAEAQLFGDGSGASAELDQRLDAELKERTQVCATLDQTPPTDVSAESVAARRLPVLASLEDALYQYRLLTAAERALADREANRLQSERLAKEEAALASAMARTKQAVTGIDETDYFGTE